MTMTATALGAEVPAIDGATAARSMMYQAFSHLFAFPADGGEWLERIRSLGITMAGLPYDPGDVAMTFQEAPAHLAERYTELFDNCNGRIRIPLRESPYLRTDARTVWEDLVRFYEHFGLDFTVERTPVWPDHLTVLLDMMHYLTFLQAAGGSEETLLHAQTDFLERHFMSWIDNFHQAFRSVDDGAPYDELAGWLVDFLKADLTYLTSRKDCL